MKAAVFDAVGVLKLKEVPEPSIVNHGDVKVRVLACGICGTDLHILHNPPHHPATIGVTLGHEFVGEVVEVGSEVSSVAPGDRVVVRPMVTCGTCADCLAGAPNHCAAMTVHGVFDDGGLADFVVVAATACLPISPRVPVHIAALVEPLACVLNAVRKANVIPGDNVVILGAGAIGLMFLALARSAGAGNVVVVEPSGSRAAIASTMGATRVVDPTRESSLDIVTSLFNGGANVVIDAVGSQFANAVALAGRRARIVLFGMNTAAETPIKQHLITEKELVVLGSFVGQHSFPDAIRLVESDIIDFSPIVSHRYPLDVFVSQLDEIRGGTVVKAIVTMGVD